LLLLCSGCLCGCTVGVGEVISIEPIEAIEYTYIRKDMGLAS